jgi:DNA helicase HerA-like ATPase
MAEIIELLRAGKIVILDLSDGGVDIQRTCTDHVSKAILDDAMVQFVQQRRTNLIQMYFEEAHNLLRHKDSQDLTQIYDLLATEGPKFGIGLCYATQDVECIPDGILQNTHKCFTLHGNYWN